MQLFESNNPTCRGDFSIGVIWISYLILYNIQVTFIIAIKFDQDNRTIS